MTNDQRPTTNDQRPTIDEAALRSSLVVGPWSSGTARYRLPALLCLVGLAIGLPALGRAQAQPPNRAALIIRHGDGQVVTACVSFSEPTISGLELVERANISYLAQSGGGGSAVCKLDGEGCDYPAEDCFCKCKGGACAYWAYQHLRGGRWSYSQIGAGAFRVEPGSVEGWAWGAGTVQAGAAPPALSFEQVCQVAAGGAAPATLPPALDATVAIVATAPPPPSSPPLPSPQPIVRPTRTARPPAQPRPTGVAAPAGTPVPATAAPALAPQAPPTQAPPPTPPATRASTAAGAPAATVIAAGAAAPTRLGPPSGGTPSTASYLAFGGLVLLLVGGIAAVLLRRRAW